MKKALLSFIILSFCFKLFSQESQNSIIKNFNSGNYTIYKVVDNKKFEKVKKKWPVEISKSGDKVTSVLVKRSGILDELFKPDVPGYPAYFAYKIFRLSFLKSYAIYYEWNGKQEAKTKYVLVKNGGNFSLNLKETNLAVAKYATATFKNQTSARANINEAKAEKAEADRLASSLQNKQVSKIEIKLVNQPTKVAHFSEAIQYGVIATLKNGSTLKTPNLGGKLPWSDFKLTHKGASNTIDEVRVDEDASSLTEDAVILNITSKYHTTLKASKKINTTNDVSIQVNYNGFYGGDRRKHMVITQGVDGQHAGNGDWLTVKIKTVIHKQTGAKINKIEVYNETKKKTLARYKLSPTTELIINAKGGNGMSGWKGRKGDTVGGNGGDGGRGGNVNIIKDPSVSNVKITINNQGGKGGNGGPPYYNTGSKGSNGRTGKNGVTSKKTQIVNINF